MKILIWACIRFSLKTLAAEHPLRLLLPAPALFHWSFDGWRTVQDTKSRDPLGVYVADLPAGELTAGREIVFTLYWQREQRWEGVNYSVVVE